MALVVAANRTRHPGDAETLARLARRFAGRGVVGFGLSNDETKGPPELFEKAFRIARDAGLLAVPHAGELRGERSVRGAVEVLGASRLGHGVRAVEDEATVRLHWPSRRGARGLPGVQRRARRRRCGRGGAGPGAAGRRVCRCAGRRTTRWSFRSGVLEQYEAVRDSAGAERRPSRRPGPLRDPLGSAAPAEVKQRASGRLDPGRARHRRTAPIVRASARRGCPGRTILAGPTVKGWPGAPPGGTMRHSSTRSG
jgi:hypothetical protein